MSDRPVAPPADPAVADGPVQANGAQASGAQASAAQASGAQASGAQASTAQASEPPSRVRAWLGLALRLLNSKPVRWGFVAAAVALGVYVVADQWTEVRAGLASMGFLAIAGALVAVLLGLVATMQVWRVLLAALGSPLATHSAARVFFLGQLGKYVPGSIWPVVAQMELGTAHRVPRHRSASASVLTMLFCLLAGLLAALVTLPFAPGARSYRWVFLAAPVLLICLFPRVLNRILDRLLRLARQPALEQPLAGRAVVGGLAWALASWALFGLQIWLLAIRLGAPDGRAALLSIGGFAFAWCVGFVVVFAPAGAGVREALLIATLSPMLGVGKATAVTLVSRVLMTGGDLITAGTAAALARARGRPGRETAP
jgi:glycosyltransferase 2 family protein